MPLQPRRPIARMMPQRPGAVGCKRWLDRECCSSIKWARSRERAPEPHAPKHDALPLEMVEPRVAAIQSREQLRVNRADADADPSLDVVYQAPIACSDCQIKCFSE